MTERRPVEATVGTFSPGGVVYGGSVAEDFARSRELTAEGAEAWRAGLAIKQGHAGPDAAAGGTASRARASSA